METKITFCINTAKNERPYLELLLQSLLNGIDVNLHDIIIFIDSDNQNTTEMLVSQRELFPNLTIIRNKSPDPVFYQGNINYMFELSKTEIVSYIQSDMVIGLNYDKALLSHLTDNMILSSTRIEPPLHAQVDNPVTYVKNFGLTTDDFNYSNFIQFSESIKNSNKLTHYYFAPFTLYKHIWNEIGGHDVGFIKSREDSDVLVRLCLKKCNIVQCWDAIVYHFTCTSSRGLKWWENKDSEFERDRIKTDKIAVERFIKKWGMFMHPTSYQEIEQYAKEHPHIMNNIIVKNPPLNENNFEFL